MMHGNMNVKFSESEQELKCVFYWTKMRFEQ